MTSESLDSLVAVPFDRRVVPHDDDPLNRYSDFDGKPTVVYPWSDDGLRHAIRIKQHLGCCSEAAGVARRSRGR